MIILELPENIQLFRSFKTLHFLYLNNHRYVLLYYFPEKYIILDNYKICFDYYIKLIHLELYHKHNYLSFYFL